MSETGAGGTEQDRAVVLWVGRDEPMFEAIRASLDRHGVAVEAVPADGDPLTAAIAVAPDLVLLAGAAARQGGQQVLQRLAGHPITSVMPVALLSDEASLDDRLRAFRSGVVAVVPRGASAYAIADRLAELVRELPERTGEVSGELGEATLEELAELVTHELRTGILSVEPEGEGESLRLVLGSGKPVAEAVEQFVARLRPLVAKAEPVRYAFHEEPGGRFGLLDDETDDEHGDPTLFRGLRVLVMDNDPGRADVLAQALREREALVAVTNVSVDGLARARERDPEVIVLDAAAIEGQGFEAVRSLRRDPRLRWAALLIARWEELWPEGAPMPDMGKLAARLEPLVEQDRRLEERAREDEAFDTRLELTGPSRLLRALVEPSGTRRVTARTAKATVEVDVGDGLVIGARSSSQGDGPGREGIEALATMMTFGSARVHVERRSHPASANLMAPVDEAIARAVELLPDELPSVQPPASPELAAAASSAASGPAADAPPPSRATPRVTPRATDRMHALASASGARPAVPRPGRGARKATAPGVGQPPPPTDGVPTAKRPALRPAAAAPAKSPPETDARARQSGPATAERSASSQSIRPPAGVLSDSDVQPLPSSPPPAGGVPAGLFGVSEAPPVASPAAAPPKPPPPPAAPRSPTDDAPTVPPPAGAPPVRPAAEPQAAAAPGGPPAVEVEAAEREAPEREAPERGAPAREPAPAELDAAPAPAADEGSWASLADEPTELVDRAADRPAPRRGGRALWLAVALLAVGGAAVAALYLVPRLLDRPSALARRGAAGGPAEEGLGGGSGAAERAGQGVDGGSAGVAADAGAEPAVIAAGDGGSAGSAAEADAGAAAATPARDGGVAHPEPAEDGEPAEDDALAELDEPVRRDPAESDRLVLEARRQIEDGNLAEAERTLALATKYDDRNPRLEAGYGWLYLARGDLDRAREHAEKAVDARPRRAAYRVLYGDVLAAQGEQDAARREWHRALRYDEDNREARKRLWK